MRRGTLAVIGAGPIGIEAAIAAATVGYDVRVFERGGIGAAARLWGPVRMFTPWRLNRSTLGARLAKEAGAPEVDPEACPTGDELVEQYLAPLAAHGLLRGRIETNLCVASIARDGLQKGDLFGKPERALRPFRLLCERDGEELDFLADAIIDASGTYATPRWLGSGGAPAAGERSTFLRRHLPDALDRDRETFAGKRTLVVGAGMSAATLVRNLVKLIDEVPTTEVVWAVRSDRTPLYAAIAGDVLPARAQLLAAANAIAQGASKNVKLIAGVTVARLWPEGDGARVLLRGPSTESDECYDNVISLVGYRPDRALWEELQIHECYASGAPMKLASAMLGANGGGSDCLAQTSPGPDALASPEPGFVVIGQKSYGRGSNFLLRVGHEQVRDALRLLSGEMIDLA